MLIKPIEFFDEEWKLITNNIVSNIKENYYIASNYGFISNIDYNNHHKIYSIKYGGQFNNRAYVNITDINGKGLLCILPRIIAKLFCYGYREGLEVNHIDGNPMNNYYKNLEWVTRKENIRHAYDNGLIESLISEDMAREICKYLEEDKLSSNEIAKVTGLINISSNPTALISAIKKGKLWIHISNQYKFPKGRHDRLFTDEQAENICLLLQENPLITNSEIITLLNIHTLNNDDYHKYSNVISSIRSRRKYTYISCNYNF